MRLKSFGCSFIFGTDLSDHDKNPLRPFSELTWPAHLARHLGLQYECFARPGSGNLQIAERVLSHLTDPEPCFYVIGWTWIDRFDFTNCNIENDPKQAQWNNWTTLMPVDTSDLARTYYKDLHSEYRDKLTSLMQIKLVTDALIQRKQLFLMTYMDELMFDQRWNHTPAVLDLQQAVRPLMTDFEQQTFLDYSRRKGFEISATLHPLESAHRAAAEHIIKVVDTQKTIDPVQPALF